MRDSSLVSRTCSASTIFGTWRDSPGCGYFTGYLTKDGGVHTLTDDPDASARVAPGSYVTIDWGGVAQGQDSLAIRQGNAFYVNDWLDAGAPVRTFDFGLAADDVLVGEWNSDGDDALAARRGNIYFAARLLEYPDEVRSCRFGRASDEVSFGDWDGF